jgi:hypothetical protein
MSIWINAQSVGAFGERAVEVELLRRGWIPANVNATVKNAAANPRSLRTAPGTAAGRALFPTEQLRRNGVCDTVTWGGNAVALRRNGHLARCVSNKETCNQRKPNIVSATPLDAANEGGCLRLFDELGRREACDTSAGRGWVRHRPPGLELVEGPVPADQ